MIMPETNPVVHFEMPYEDRERMADFYSKAFGWKMNMLGENMGGYVVAHTAETDENNMVKRPGTINGGFYPKNKDLPAQCPSVVIAVADIETAIKNIIASGGKMLGEPVEIPGVGKYASFFDTEGNRSSVLQPNNM